MYIFKNAVKGMMRSKGRNILIGIIIFVIAISSCIALSIREAAEQAKEDSLENLEITAQITMNRQNMMSGKDSKEDMKEAISSMQALTLDELEQYAGSDNVKDFYYTASVSVNGSDAFEPVDTTDTSDSTESENSSEFGPGKDMGGRMGVQGDFTLTGYSSDAAMTDFVDGSESISDGAIFEENDTSNQCIISEELATYNSLSVGDAITITNPNKDDETYTLTISGIYQSKQTENSEGSMMGGFSASFDSANKIYTSYENLKAIADASESNAETTTDETTGTETTTALRSQISGTYAFANVDNYEAFKEAAEKELDENYTVTSNDVTQYEQSLLPLENLSKYAGYFLAIILVIGGIILIVLNIFNIRERKYEIGVLAAVGMKKEKIALQFILELLCVTFAAIIIGTAAGAVTSIPITNKLLEQQIESTNTTESQQEENFGRTPGGGNADTGSMQKPSGAEYVTQVSSATDLTVVAQLIGIGILLTIISGCVAVVFILRYDPLRILSNRD